MRKIFIFALFPLFISGTPVEIPCLTCPGTDSVPRDSVIKAVYQAAYTQTVDSIRDTREARIAPLIAQYDAIIREIDSLKRAKSPIILHHTDTVYFPNKIYIWYWFYQNGVFHHRKITSK